MIFWLQRLEAVDLRVTKMASTTHPQQMAITALQVLLEMVAGLVGPMVMVVVLVADIPVVALDG